MKRMIPLILVLGSATVLQLSCKTTARDSSLVKAESNLPPEGDFVLPGSAETLLLYDQDGPWQLVRLDREPKKLSTIDVPHEFESPYDVPKSVSSADGKFYILAQEKIYIVDGDKGTVEKTWEAPKAVGFTIDKKGKGYIFTADAIQELDTSTGKTGKSVKFAAEAWIMSDSRVLAANTKELMIVEKESFKVVKTVSLDGSPKLVSPILNVSWDKANNRVFVSGSPSRPRAKGTYANVDLNKFVMTEMASPATFNGSRYFLNKGSRFVELQHTSTPTDSTHVMLSSIEADGSLRKIGTHGTAFDLFESNNNLQFNEDQTLAVMSSACFTGFCSAGKGLIVYDIKNDKRLPNLTLDFLGFQPRGGYFKKP